MIVWVRGLAGKMKDKDNELLAGLIEAHGTYRLLNHFFTHTILASLMNTTFLNFKLVLLQLNHKASAKQLSVTDFFKRSDFNTAINVTFSYLLFVWALVEYLYFSIF